MLEANWLVYESFLLENLPKLTKVGINSTIIVQVLHSPESFLNNFFKLTEGEAHLRF